MLYDTKVGAAIRALREELGWSRNRLNDAMTGLGFAWHPMTVKRVEDGERPIRLREAYGVAFALGCSISEIVEHAEPERHDCLITVHAYGLTGRQRDALFNRIADAAHARDEEVTCSCGPLTNDYIRTLLDEDNP